MDEKKEILKFQPGRGQANFRARKDGMKSPKNEIKSASL